MRHIGIDVGGTNTDAVLLEDGRILGAVKVPTTQDVTGGIVKGLKELRRLTSEEPGVDAIMIGTTHFINAVLQRRDLTPSAALRIGVPGSRSLLPFCDWPADLVPLVHAGIWTAEGGHEYDGRPFLPLDEKAVASAAREIRALGIKAVGICSMFSPVNASHERRAAEIIAEEIPDAAITCSADLSRIGILERENATLLNTALTHLAKETIKAFDSAIKAARVDAPLYITRNDGTVADAQQAGLFPVYSFASGATNSMRGATFLSGLGDAIVADVGGTTADVGQIKSGFPRESNSVVRIGGVRTLFRMPDVLSIPLGGGSLVGPNGREVGPISVGFRLTTEARVFGGGRLTATDLAVAAGLTELGEPQKVADLPKSMRSAFEATCRQMIEEAVDRVKTRAGDVPLVAVGGGAFLVPERLEGVSEVVRTPYGYCANAVGAAIAQVSGEVDQVFRDVSRERALEDARVLATERAVAAGARADSLQVIEMEDLPLAYVPGNALRVRVRVVGDFATQV